MTGDVIVSLKSSKSEEVVIWRMRRNYFLKPIPYMESSSFKKVKRKERREKDRSEENKFSQFKKSIVPKITGKFYLYFFLPCLY